MKNAKDNGENVVLYTIIALTFYIVASVTYSTYLFMDISRLFAVVGIHVTKGARQAITDSQNNVTRKVEDDGLTWNVYTEKEKGFELRAPVNFIKKTEAPEHLLALREMSPGVAGRASIIMTVSVDSLDVSTTESLEDVLKEKGLTWNPEWKEEMLGGRMGLRIGIIKDPVDGLLKDRVYWKLADEQKVILLESVYYLDNTKTSESIFDEIVADFKFI